MLLTYIVTLYHIHEAARFLVKVVNRNVIRICKMLISCVKLDHLLYSINYSIKRFWQIFCGSYPFLLDTACDW